MTTVDKIASRLLRLELERVDRAKERAKRYHKRCLYQNLKNAGCAMDSHESDLYVEATETSRMIIEAAQRADPSITMSYFQNQTNGELWIDLPFRYEPFWAAKAR